MNNFHSPNGDSPSPDDHVLHRTSNADAWNDADAFDTRLNEIARNNGSPNTRPHQDHDRPNVRTEDTDGTREAESLAATATAFHQRIAAAQSRGARAAGPDPQLWEKIMANTTQPPASNASSAAAPPWGLQADTTPRTQPRQPRRRSAPPAFRRQHVWNMAANIGLVIAILLAGFGIWRISGEPGWPGGAGDDPVTPQFAMQPSTQVATPDATEEMVIAPPVATPQPTTNCDFSSDIPIFQGVDTSPVEGTALLLTPDGDVVLTCPEEPEGVVLMTTSPHGSVSPLDWPGVVLIPSYGEKPDEARTRVLNLVTGVVAELGYRHVGVIGQETEGHITPWYIGPAVDDSSDFLLLDLRTMEHRQLSDLAGASIPEDAGIMMSTSETGATLVLGLMSRSTVEGNGTLITDSTLPGDLLVLNGNLDAESWISVPDDFPPVTDITVSPDGTHAALHGATDQMNQDREDAFSIVRLSDGEEIERSETIIDGPGPAEGIWVQGSKAFAYIRGSELRLLPISPNLPDQPIFEADGPLARLSITIDPGTVLVEQQWDDDLATMVARQQTPVFYSVEIGSRDATMFTGVDVSNNVSPWPYPHRFLVTFQPEANQGDTITFDVIDAVTGDVVGILDDVPLDDSGYEGYPDLGLRAVASSPDGNAEIIAFDSQHTYLMRVSDGQYQIEHLAPPEGILAETPMPISVHFSPDGTLVAMNGQNDESGTRYILKLTETELTWQAVPPSDGQGAYIPFVPGTGIAGESSDPAATAGYDFSALPDGTGFMTNDELGEALRTTEDNFSWPEGYDPDIDAIIEKAFPPGNSRHQEGGEYTILGGYNQCAWYQTWLDAFEQGDDATAQEALRIMTEVIPTFPNQDWSVVKWQMESAALAAEGDPAMVQQSVTANCQGLYWESGQ